MNKVCSTLIFLQLMPLLQAMNIPNPLMKAIFDNAKKNVKEILAQPNGNPNVSYRSLTALQWSVEMNKREIIYDLLSHGADITVRDASDSNLLHTAISHANAGIKESHDVIEALLCYNVSRTDKDMRGKTPFEKANEETRKVITEFDNRPKSMLVFLQALHPRLGFKSGANTLTLDACQLIFSFLRPDIARRH